MTDDPLLPFVRAVAPEELVEDPETTPETVLATVARHRPNAVSAALDARLADANPLSVARGDLRVLAVLARATPELAAEHAGLLVRVATTASDDRRGIALGAVGTIAERRPDAVPSAPLRRLVFEVDPSFPNRRQALLALLEVDLDAVRSWLASLDRASVAVDELRLLGVVALRSPAVAVERVDLLVDVAATADGDRRDAALDALFDLARWIDEPGDVAAVREAVERRPAAVADRLRSVVADLDPERHVGDALEVMAVLAPAVPGPVAAAVPTLLAAAEGEFPAVRRDALAVLAALATERPDAIPADRLRHVAAEETVDPATRRHALAVLAAVDPDAGAEALAAHCERLADEHDYAYHRDDFLAALVGDHPDAFPSLSAAVAEQVVALPSGDQDDALAAFEALAREDPAAVAPGAATLAPLALDYRRPVRVTVARTLRHVAREHPDAVPEWARALTGASSRELRVREADAGREATWPLGGLAAASPAVAELAADRLVSVLGEEYAPEDEEVVAYVAELERGDVEAARTVVRALSEAAFRRWPVDGKPTEGVVSPAGLVLAVLEARPAVAPAVVDPLVDGQADGVVGKEMEEFLTANVQQVVETVAEAAPGRFRCAVERRFGDPESYVRQPGGYTESRRQAATVAFEDYDVGYFEVNDWLSLSEVREVFAEEYDPDDDAVPEGTVRRLVHRHVGPIVVWLLLNLVVAISWFDDRFGPDDGGGDGGGGDDGDGGEGGGGGAVEAAADDEPAADDEADEDGEAARKPVVAGPGGDG